MTSKATWTTAAIAILFVLPAVPVGAQAPSPASLLEQVVGAPANGFVDGSFEQPFGAPDTQDGYLMYRSDGAYAWERAVPSTEEASNGDQSIKLLSVPAVNDDDNANYPIRGVAGAKASPGFRLDRAAGFQYDILHQVLLETPVSTNHFVSFDIDGDGIAGGCFSSSITEVASAPAWQTISSSGQYTVGYWANCAADGDEADDVPESWGDGNDPGAVDRTLAQIQAELPPGTLVKSAAIQVYRSGPAVPPAPSVFVDNFVLKVDTLTADGFLADITLPDGGLSIILDGDSQAFSVDVWLLNAATQTYEMASSGAYSLYIQVDCGVAKNAIDAVLSSTENCAGGSDTTSFTLTKGFTASDTGATVAFSDAELRTLLRQEAEVNAVHVWVEGMVNGAPAQSNYDVSTQALIALGSNDLADARDAAVWYPVPFVAVDDSFGADGFLADITLPGGSPAIILTGEALDFNVKVWRLVAGAYQLADAGNYALYVQVDCGELKQAVDAVLSDTENCAGGSDTSTLTVTHAFTASDDGAVVTFTHDELQALQRAEAPITAVHVWAAGLVADTMAQSNYALPTQALILAGDLPRADALDTSLWHPVPMVVGATPGDADGDGCSDVNEELTGSDPLNPDSTCADPDADNYDTTDEDANVPPTVGTDPTNHPSAVCIELAGAATPCTLTSAPAASNVSSDPDAAASHVYTVRNLGLSNEIVDIITGPYTFGETPTVLATYTLAPAGQSGSTAVFTYVVAVPHGSPAGFLSNVTLTAVPQGDKLQATEEAPGASAAFTAETQVNRVHIVRLAVVQPTPDPTPTGTAPVFTVNVLNSGNGPDSFTLASDAPEGAWAADGVIASAVTNGCTLTGSNSGTLAGDASCNVRVTFLAPTASLPSGTASTAAFTATSTGDATVDESKDLVSTKATYFAPTLTVTTPANTPTGTQPVFTVKIANTATVADSFDLTSLVQGTGWGGSGTLSPGATSPCSLSGLSTGSIPASGFCNVRVTMTAPTASIPSGTTSVADFTAQSAGDVAKSAGKQLTATKATYANPLLTPSTPAPIETGVAPVFTVTAKNMGAVADSFDLSSLVIGTGWGGSGTIATATTATPCALTGLNTGSIAAGASCDVRVTLTAPTAAVASNEITQATFRADSIGDLAKSSSVTLQATKAVYGNPSVLQVFGLETLTLTSGASSTPGTVTGASCTGTQVYTITLPRNPTAPATTTTGNVQCAQLNVDSNMDGTSDAQYAIQFPATGNAASRSFTVAVQDGQASSANPLAATCGGNPVAQFTLTSAVGPAPSAFTTNLANQPTAARCISVTATSTGTGAIAQQFAVSVPVTPPPTPTGSQPVATVNVYNAGTVSDSFALSSAVVASGWGGAGTISAGGANACTLTAGVTGSLAAGASCNVRLTLAAPDAALLGGTQTQARVTAASQQDSALSAFGVADAVKALYTGTLAKTTPAPIPTGTQPVITVTITNTGEAADAYDLSSLVVGSGWGGSGTIAASATAPACTLTGLVTGSISPNASCNVDVTLAAPTPAVPSAQETQTTFSVQSNGNVATSFSIVLSATKSTYGAAGLAVVAPAAPSETGNSPVFTVTITNPGPTASSFDLSTLVVGLGWGGSGTITVAGVATPCASATATGMLAVAASCNVKVTLAAPTPPVPSGQGTTSTFTALSTGDSALSASAPLTTTKASYGSPNVLQLFGLETLRLTDGASSTPGTVSGSTCLGNALYTVSVPRNPTVPVAPTAGSARCAQVNLDTGADGSSNGVFAIQFPATGTSPTWTVTVTGGASSNAGAPVGATCTGTTLATFQLTAAGVVPTAFANALVTGHTTARCIFVQATSTGTGAIGQQYAVSFATTPPATPTGTSPIVTVAVRNDGSVPDAFAMASAVVASGWGGNGAVTAGGANPCVLTSGVTNTLAVGASCMVRVTLTAPTADLASSTSTQALLTATSQQDTNLAGSGVVDAVKATYTATVTAPSIDPVATGTQPVFTVTIKNTGNFPDSYDISSLANAPGWAGDGVISLSVSGPCASITNTGSLAAGASCKVKVTFDAPTDSVPLGSANPATFTAESQQDLTRDFTATLTPTKSGLAVALSQTGPASVPTGTAPVFTVTIQNAGADVDNFTLSGAGTGWGGSGTLSLPATSPCPSVAFTGSLAPGASCTVVVTLAPPTPGVPSGTSTTASVTATSVSDALVTQSINLVTAKGVYFAAISAAPAAPTGTPGQTVDIAFVVSHAAAAVADNFTLALSAPTGVVASSGFTIEAGSSPDCGVAAANSGTTLSVPAFGSCNLKVRVPVKADAALNAMGGLTLTATSVGDPSVSALVVMQVKAGPLYVATITPAPADADTWQGHTVLVHVPVKNLGNTVESIRLKATSVPAGWTVTLTPNTDANHVPNLANQATFTVDARVTAPWNAVVGSTHTIGFTAYAGAAGTVAPTAPTQVLDLDFTVRCSDLDRDGIPDSAICAGGPDQDRDNDGWTNAEEAGVSDPANHFKTPLDKEGDGVPDTLEMYADFTFSDVGCTHTWPAAGDTFNGVPCDYPSAMTADIVSQMNTLLERVRQVCNSPNPPPLVNCDAILHAWIEPLPGQPAIPMRGTLPYAIPDAQSLVKVDIYNIKTNGAGLPQRANGNLKIATFTVSDAACGGQASLRYYQLANPTNGQPIPDTYKPTTLCIGAPTGDGFVAQFAFEAAGGQYLPLPIGLSGNEASIADLDGDGNIGVMLTPYVSTGGSFLAWKKGTDPDIKVKVDALTAVDCIAPAGANTCLAQLPKSLLFPAGQPANQALAVRATLGIGLAAKTSVYNALNSGLLAAGGLAAASPADSIEKALEPAAASPVLFVNLATVPSVAGDGFVAAFQFEIPPNGGTYHNAVAADVNQDGKISVTVREAFKRDAVTSQYGLYAGTVTVALHGVVVPSKVCTITVVGGQCTVQFPVSEFPDGSLPGAFTIQASTTSGTSWYSPEVSAAVAAAMTNPTLYDPAAGAADALEAKVEGTPVVFAAVESADGLVVAWMFEAPLGAPSPGPVTTDSDGDGKVLFRAYTAVGSGTTYHMYSPADGVLTFKVGAGAPQPCTFTSFQSCDLLVPLSELVEEDEAVTAVTVQAILGTATSGYELNRNTAILAAYVTTDAVFTGAAPAFDIYESAVDGTALGMGPLLVATS